MTTGQAAVSPLERATERLAAGRAASDDGHPAAAVRELRAGLRILDRASVAERAAVTPLRARLMISLAWAESERGRVDVGFRLLDDAEPMLERADPGHRAVLRAQRALMLMRAGRNDAALAEYDAAVAGLDERTQPLDLVRALNNRSLVHLEAGQVSAARVDLRRCGRIADRHGLRLHAALSAVNLGCLDVLAGDLPAALRAFSDARATYEQLAPGRLPSLAVERARALLAAGLFTAADHELAYAVEQADDQRLSYTHADALLARAEAALLADRPDAAAEWARQARSRFRGRHNARRSALAALLELRVARPDGPVAERALAVRCLALARRLRRLGLPEDARVATLVAVRSLVRGHRTARAARILAEVPRPRGLDRLDTRLLWRLASGEVAAASGRVARARRHWYAGLAELQRYRGRFGSLDLQTGASAHGQDLARAGLRAAIASGSAPSVFRWGERARAQALLLPPVRAPDHGSDGVALAELRQARQLLRTAEVTGSAGATTAQLRSRAARLERSILEGSWSLRGSETVAIAPVSLAAVRGALAGAALLCYLQAGASLHVLVVTETSVRLVPLGPYAMAAEAATRLRADLDTRAGRVLPARLATALEDATRHDAEVLSAAVLDPMLSLVGDRPLVVVPTGALFLVPWSVLAACRGRPVTVSASATTWHSAQERRAGGAPQEFRRILLVAGPGTSRGESEVQAVAGLYPGGEVLTGPAATPAATLAGLGRADLAHLAAHGQHQPESALFSSLELAGGPLFGYDLRQVPTPPTVVLSCCDLGRSDVRPGDETLGLAAALLSNGTATVVASVARVGDELAMAVMTDFHRALVGGLCTAAGLARAAAAHPDSGFICLGAG